MEMVDSGHYYPNWLWEALYMCKCYGSVCDVFRVGFRALPPKSDFMHFVHGGRNQTLDDELRSAFAKWRNGRQLQRGEIIFFSRV